MPADSPPVDTTSSRVYVLGHSQRELSRLERQAEMFAAPTEETLRQAGIGRGMRILDVGCGVGDVSLLAARLVGSTGAVLGIDRSPEALDIGRRRAAGAGHDWVKFEVADIGDYTSDEQFDAVVGRFVLMYLVDPGAALRRLTRHIRPGGFVAFVEIDIDQAGSLPEMPLLKQCIYWTTQTYRRAGIEPNMGSRLFSTFHAAGLDAKLTGATRIEGSIDSVVYEFAAETIRSLFPQMIAFGIATEREVGLETLADRLRAAAGRDHCFFLPRIVGAWARVT